MNPERQNWKQHVLTRLALHLKHPFRDLGARRGFEIAAVPLDTFPPSGDTGPAFILILVGQFLKSGVYLRCTLSNPLNLLMMDVVRLRFIVLLVFEKL